MTPVAIAEETVDLVSADALRSRMARLQRELGELQHDVRRAAGAELEMLPAGELVLLECRVEEQRIALQLEQVDEVVPAAWLAPLPEAPPWVLGMLTLRGASLPVLDVAARVARRRRTLDLTDLIVICRPNGRPIGLVVQQVSGVVRIAAETLAPPPADLPHAPYLLGFGTTDDSPLALISIERLVALSDLPEVA